MTSEILPRNLENAVYNPLTDMWMIPQNDPYTLENFQQAYDNLASGKSLQTLTRAEAAEFAEPEQLKPTHFALRIYPRNEEEQWKVEMMEDVNVVYSPFNYSGLTEEEVAQVPQTRAEITSPFEVSPYTVTYDYTEATDGGPTGPVTYQLPVLYAVWPVEKPLPDDLEYKVDYEVFLPHDAPAKRNSVASNILENEAIMSALGIYVPSTRSETHQYVIVSGYLMCNDNTLGRNVLMAELWMTCQIGSNICWTMTDSNGYFSYAMSPIAATFMSITIRYSDTRGRWNIVAYDGSGAVSTIPYEVTVSADNPDTEKPYWNQVDGRYSYGEIIIEPDDYRANEIHRAVNYFFNGQTVFPTVFPKVNPKSSAVLNIVASSKSGGSVAGSFLSGSKFVMRDNDGKIIETSVSVSRITIYNNGSPNGEVIGTTLHEIGHAIHDFNDPFIDTPHHFIKESFASYVGWYLAEEYYKSLGWIKPGGSSSITYGDRQSWTKTTNSTFGNSNYGWYSPLFVDLTDDYNQKTSPTSSYPNDNITGIPAYAIWDIISTSTDYWTEVRPKIANLAGTSPNFDEWISHFDESPANNDAPTIK